MTKLVGSLTVERYTVATERDVSREAVGLVTVERDAAQTESQAVRQQTEEFAEASRDVGRIIALLRRDMLAMERQHGAGYRGSREVGKSAGSAVRLAVRMMIRETWSSADCVESE